uniref:Aldehyde dehydrogenase domain-containing protein n=1 Tax=Moniliophthora roreri TaxID=221103 RepID=A0A0W0F7X1_MONRR
MGVFKTELKTPTFNGTLSFNTGLFINGEWVDPVEGGTVDVVNPATRKVITSVSAGTDKDVDKAVDAAWKAYRTSWGHKVPGAQRGVLLNKLADLMEKHKDELAALESLNVGKPYSTSQRMDVPTAVACFRYYAGWTDKVHGKTIETTEAKFTYTRHEPYGVVGQIIPWNFPLVMLSWKIAPAVATGNCCVLKPSEVTPLTALKFAGLINEAGFPPGVINIVNGYGNTVGNAIALHPDIRKIAFTGSTLVGRKIQEASANSNLKVVSLELGGKSPNIIFDDADLEQAVKWACVGIYANMGQACTAGSRIFVHSAIYDKFLQAFTAATQAFASGTGDPFDNKTQHGPQVSQVQFDRIMSYLESARTDGATIHQGGDKHDSSEGYFIQPTIITNAKPTMKVVKEEIFGPVGVVIKFDTEEEVLAMANDTAYGLAAAVFTQNNARAHKIANSLESGTVWVNCCNIPEISIPFGGYKQSGFGRELGEYALETYTQVKAVHVNIGLKL